MSFASYTFAHIWFAALSAYSDVITQHSSESDVISEFGHIFNSHLIFDHPNEKSNMEAQRWFLDDDDRSTKSGKGGMVDVQYLDKIFFRVSIQEST